MLSMKQELSNGVETIIEVESVHFSRIPRVNEADGPDSVPYLEGRLNEKTFGFNEGTVYVMNNAGKTIGIYHLNFPIQ